VGSDELDLLSPRKKQRVLKAARSSKTAKASGVGRKGKERETSSGAGGASGGTREKSKRKHAASSAESDIRLFTSLPLSHLYSDSDDQLAVATAKKKSKTVKGGLRPDWQARAATRSETPFADSDDGVRHSSRGTSVPSSEFTDGTDGRSLSSHHSCSEEERIKFGGLSDDEETIQRSQLVSKHRSNIAGRITPNVKGKTSASASAKVLWNGV
jgi:hypothetical protein